MKSNTRATLLERLRDGADQLSWKEFYARYWPLVYASARRRGCSDHTAEEVVQHVMLTVFQQRDFFQYDPARGRFRDWLGTVVRNQVAEIRRRPDARVRPIGGDSAVALKEVPSQDPPPEAAWEEAYENQLLGVLLDTVRREVNPRVYLAFELSTLGDLSGGQVEKLTGMTRNAVYKSRKRVLQRLAELGATYRHQGQLDQRIKEALQSRPAAVVERSMSGRIENTMRSR
jgi:RNA polymerase sigma-70 factor (ECF subfamily)